MTLDFRKCFLHTSEKGIPLHDMIRNIILDFDGTIGDTQKLIVTTMQQTLAKNNLPERSVEECAAMIGLPLKQTFTDLVPMSDEMGNLCEKTYREIFLVNNKTIPVEMFPHVLETIRNLHQQGLVLTIASSRYRPSLEDFVNKMHLRPYISYIVSAMEVAHAKPDPEMVFLTMKEMEMKPEETLVVGDTVYDIQMGQRAGIKTCGVTYGNGTREQMISAKADYIIDEFPQLINISKVNETEVHV